VGLLNPHLDDTAFADLWSARLAAAPGDPPNPAESHLRGCADCRARYTAFTAWLEGLRTDAHAEADDVLGPDRLAAQQAQIAKRLEALEQPARVIAFPRFTRPVARPNTGHRWIGAAAAAGLVVGLGLGQMLNWGSVSPSGPLAGHPSQIAQGLAPVSERLGAQPAAQISDETYLYDYEVLSQARVPESLQYLNVITPSARDYDSR
jgi:hypothetical protein